MCWLSDPSEPQERWQVSIGHRQCRSISLAVLLNLFLRSFSNFSPCLISSPFFSNLPNLDANSFLSLKSCLISVSSTVLARKSRQYSWQQLKFSSLISLLISTLFIQSLDATNRSHRAIDINKNNINLHPMQFSHHQQYPNPNPQSGTTTESQIISTLNSSIEDLLSKILKVKEDYAISAQELHQSYEQICSWEKTQLNADPESSPEPIFQKHLSQNEDASTSHSSEHLSLKVIQNLDRRPGVVRCYHIPAKHATLSSPNESIPYSNIIKAASLKEIESSPPLCERLHKGKIHSLFDSSSIKEVEASRIFQQAGEGKFDTLEQHTREVSQVMITSSQIPKELPSSLSLSDFQIGAEVGSGKFGQVYVCRHRATGCLFALKKIFKSTIRQYQMQSQLCLQLKILYTLNHPNIIKLYAHFSDEYHIFLLMEYIEGGQLLSKLKSNEKYVSRVVEQIVDTVDYIHSRGIVHRDIKPENIVIAFNNTAKLCDFGWAGIFDHKNMKTTFCGTLDYVSPEMKDKGLYTSKVDLWSIGVLTFELLTGSAPFKNEINQWKKKGSKRNIQWDWHILYPPEISALGESFMRNLLRENPDERASLRFCRNHFFIRKYKQQQSEINVQLYI